MGLGTTADILNKEYCFEFDKKRQNAILVSYHKYGPSKQNFKEGMRTKHFAKNMQKVIDDPAEDPETRKAATEMFHGLRQRQADYMYKNGYSAGEARLAARMQGKVDKYYDEQKAQEANQRAEDTTRVIMAQRDAYSNVLQRLRGLLPMSQELVAKHKEGNK